MAGNVELTQSTGIGVASRQPVHFNQWDVKLDGKLVGYLAFGEGRKLCFVDRLAESVKSHVESEAARIANQKLAGSTEPPDTSELDQKEQELDDDIDP